MKKVITILALILTTVLTINAQTTINGSVSLAVDSYLINSPSSQYVSPYQGNCGIPNGDFVIQNDLNLNGNILYVKQGTSITVNGNFNGAGEIRVCNNGGNTSSVSICVNGYIQNSPNFNGIICQSTLNLPVFNITKDFGYNFIVYDFAGKRIKQGVTSLNMLEDLPTGIFLILKVEGFKEEKLMIQ